MGRAFVKFSRLLLAHALLIAPLAAVGAEPEDKGSKATEVAKVAEVETEKKPKDAPVVYIPPSRGRAQTRSGGGTRGMPGLPTLSVIAPDHEAWTTQAQPTVYWYISGATAARVDFTLIEESAVEPLIEITLNGPVKEGLHALRLADFGLSLEPEATYLWFVSLVPDADQHAEDLVSGAAIRRVPTPEELQRVLESDRTGSSSYVAYAENGIWYDAINSLSKARSEKPGDAQLQEQHAAFLDQVDLPEAAAYTRR
jgi:hypothetical protein